MDINIESLVSHETAAIRTRLLDAGWDYTNIGMVKVIQETQITINFVPKLLRYRQQCKPVGGEQSGVLRWVTIPWIGLEISGDDLNERVLFAVKGAIFNDLNLQPFRDETTDMLDVFVMQDNKYVLYVNMDYPEGWGENNVL